MAENIINMGGESGSNYGKKKNEVISRHLFSSIVLYYCIFLILLPSHVLCTTNVSPVVETKIRSVLAASGGHALNVHKSPKSRTLQQNSIVKPNEKPGTNAIVESTDTAFPISRPSALPSSSPMSHPTHSFPESPQKSEFTWKTLLYMISLLVGLSACCCGLFRKDRIGIGETQSLIV